MGVGHAEVRRRDVAEDRADQRRRRRLRPSPTAGDVMRSRPPPGTGWRRLRAGARAGDSTGTSRGPTPGPDRQRRRRPDRLAHGHALRHRADRGVRIVRGREAAPGDEQALRRRAAAASDTGCRPRARRGGTASACRVPGRWSSIGRTAEPDLVVELPRGQDIVARQPIVAVDAARLAHAELRAEVRPGWRARSPARDRRGSGRTRVPGGGPPSRPRSGSRGRSR